MLLLRITGNQRAKNEDFSDLLHKPIDGTVFCDSVKLIELCH